MLKQQILRKAIKMCTIAPKQIQTVKIMPKTDFMNLKHRCLLFGMPVCLSDVRCSFNMNSPIHLTVLSAFEMNKNKFSCFSFCGYGFCHIIFFFSYLRNALISHFCHLPFANFIYYIIWMGKCKSF